MPLGRRGYPHAMPFDQGSLNPGESISVDLHPHWMYFAQPVLSLLGSLVLGIISLRFESGSNLRTWLGWLSIALIVATAVWTVLRYITWSTCHFVVTNHRIIHRSGWIVRSGIDIPLDRVNNVSISRGIIERLSGSGDLLIESAGASGQQRFIDIRRPEMVQNQIFALMQSLREDAGSPMVPAADIAGQLERLEGMMRRGTLSPEEFEAQKRRLLGS